MAVQLPDQPNDPGQLTRAIPEIGQIPAPNGMSHAGERGNRVVPAIHY